MTITVPPVQDLNKYSFARRAVKSVASRSIAPLILLEAFVEGGRTYQAYKRGGFDEARERITEEMIGAAFWFSGVAGFSKLIDHFVGKKIYKLPETDFDCGMDKLRNPLANYLRKHAEKFKDPAQAEKMIAKFKFGKVISSIILANCLVGFAVPKLNQAITNSLRSKRMMPAITEEQQSAFDARKEQEQKAQTKQYKMDDFMKNKGKDVAFGGMSTQLLLDLANSFENTPKYQLLSTDVGIAGGRAICARNNHERTEVLFRDIASSYFYMFNMPILASLFNKLEDGKSTRLDPVASKQVSDHLIAVLDDNGGKMKIDDFKNAVFGDAAARHKITPELGKLLDENKGVIELDEFMKHLKGIVSETDLPEYEKLAKGMSELQPKLAGKSMITEIQIQDVFKRGAINMPEFLRNIFYNSTQDENLFTGKVKSPVFNNELKFISRETFIHKKQELADYVELILKKAKDGEITKDLIKKMDKQNFTKNAINWGVGFAVSAAFLSTFIPKIQYWITQKLTGHNEFPGTADYSNEKK